MYFIVAKNGVRTVYQDVKEAYANYKEQSSSLASKENAYLYWSDNARGEGNRRLNYDFILTTKNGNNDVAQLMNYESTRIDVGEIVKGLIAHVKEYNVEQMKAEQKAVEDAFNAPLYKFSCESEKEIVRKVVANEDFKELLSQTLALSDKENIAFSPYVDNISSPTVSIDYEKGQFFDFATGKSGNLLQLYADVVGVSQEKALKDILADSECNYLSYAEFDKIDSYENRLYEVHELVSDYYHKILTEGTDEDAVKAREYLKARNINDKMIKRFKLGYAPASWGALVKHLRDNGVTRAEMIASGAVIESSKNGRLYDFLRDRIVFPISDDKNNVIAYGGRYIGTEVEKNPKYLNSPNSDIYVKGEVLYGYNMAKNTRQHSIIFVEGFMDCISAWQSGFDNVVACCGVAFTPEQAKLVADIGRISTVIEALDNDEAGRKNAKGIERAMAGYGVETERLDYSSAKVKDCNDLLVSKGVKGLGELCREQNVSVEVCDKVIFAENKERAREIREVLDTNDCAYRIGLHGEEGRAFIVSDKAVSLFNSQNTATQQKKNNVGLTL